MNNAGPDLIAFLETRRCQGSCKHTHTHKHKHTHRSHKCCGVLVGWSPAKSLPTPQRKADVQLVSTGAQHSPLLLWHCCLLVLPVSSSENTPNHPSIFLYAFPIREGDRGVCACCVVHVFCCSVFFYSFLLFFGLGGLRRSAMLCSRRVSAALGVSWLAVVASRKDPVAQAESFVCTGSGITT